MVGETGRGDEAVDLVDEHQPDLAILDIKMPGIDGIRAAREITASHRVAVLVLTAFSQRDLIEEARDAGVAAYLVKPFRRDELLPAIEGCWPGAARSGRSRTRSTPPARTASARPRTRSRPGGWSTRPRRVLMDQHGMSEADAFAFIQRTAMQTADPDARRGPAGGRRRRSAP